MYKVTIRWSGRVAFGAVLTLLLGCAAQSQSPSQGKSKDKAAATNKPRTLRPGLLGDGVGTLPQVEYEKVGRRMRSNDSLGKIPVAEWNAALRKQTGEEFSDAQGILILLPWVQQIDIAWEGDRLRLDAVGHLISRTASLPQVEVQRWQEELSKVSTPAGGGATTLETIGFLVQMDPLFQDDKFQVKAAEAFLARLKSLDSETIIACKNAIASNSNQAAVMLIQDDQLFRANQLQKGAIEGAIGRLK